MTPVLAALVISAGLGVVAAGVLVAWLPRRDAYLVGRSAESKSPVLYATLIPSPRELPGGPSAASRERQVYVITDLPGAHQGARGNERN